MNLSNPAAVVVPTLDAAVLRVLTGTSRPLTGRDVARIAEASQRGTQNILNRMVDQGLVDMTEAGSSRLYVLNTDHVAAEAACILSDLRGRLFARIRQQLSEWDPAPVAAAVFGSAARGDGGVDSDVDLLIVRPGNVAEDASAWASAVDRLARLVKRWSGNYASVIQLTPAQIDEMLDRNEPLVAELRADAVPLSEVDVLAVTARRTR